MLRVESFIIWANASLDPGLKQDLLPSLQVLLEDRVPAVISCALAVWEHVCPERTDLLHRPYRTICRLLVEMDEWGQLVAMRVLTIYVRRCFSKPTEPESPQNANPNFYEDGAEDTSSLDPDLVLLYKFAMQLVHSRSSAVVIALFRLFQDIAPASYLPRLIPSLIRLSRTRSPSALYPVLSTIAVVASQDPVQ
jgi:AP-3 complex subunit beta